MLGGSTKTEVAHEFIQEFPSIRNSFTNDTALTSMLDYLTGDFYNKISIDLSQLGEKAANELMDLAECCEKEPPYLRQYDALGNRVDQVVTSQAWKEQHRVSARQRLISIPYASDANAFSRLHQFAKLMLYSPASGMYSCPLAMTDGAARLISVLLSEQEGLRRDSPAVLPPTTIDRLNEAFEHLTSSDPDQFWTSGQWMTEQASGSDVSFATRTIALPITSSTSLARSEENPLSISIPGHEIRSCAPFTTHIGTQSNLASSGKRGEVFPLTGWNQGATHLLYGLKWFTSAVDAAVAVTLARIVPPEYTGRENDPEVLKIPLSCFLVFVRDQNSGALNRITVRKLKDKMGTHQLPTAELELHGTPAFLLSPPGRGVVTISHLFNITRCHNTFSALGFLQRMSALATDFASKRYVFGSILSQKPIHARVLARLASEYAFTLLPSLEMGILQGLIEDSTVSSSSSPSRTRALQNFVSLGDGVTGTGNASALLRLLTPLSKLYSAKLTVRGCSEALESFGALGYIEETHIPRLARDAQVLTIWEGTTNVCSDDVIRVFRGALRDRNTSESNSWVVFRAEVRGRVYQARKTLPSSGSTNVVGLRIVADRIDAAISLLEKYVAAVGLSKGETAIASGAFASRAQLALARELSFSLYRVYAAAAHLLYATQLAVKQGANVTTSSSLNLQRAVATALLETGGLVGLHIDVKNSSRRWDSEAVEDGPWGIVDRSLGLFLERCDSKSFEQDLSYYFALSNAFTGDKTGTTPQKSKL